MTIFPFTPSSSSPFQFQPTLDGQPYNATVPWSLFGGRYYLNLVALNGTQIWYGAISSSPTGTALQALSWSNGRALATSIGRHGYKPATTIELAINGCTPDSYNGLFPCLITGPTSFSYALAVDPGPASVLGSASYSVNLLGGIPNQNGGFFSSTLVFRVPSNQFEINP